MSRRNRYDEDYSKRLGYVFDLSGGDSWLRGRDWYDLKMPDDGEDPHKGWIGVMARVDDHDLYTQANYNALREIMNPLVDEETVIQPKHFVYWVQVYVLDDDGHKVMEDDQAVYTDAFDTLRELIEGFLDYPCLDDNEYSRLEMEALDQAIQDQGGRYVEKDDPEAENWGGKVAEWLSDNGFERELESRDSSGPYPRQGPVLLALYDLELMDMDSCLEVEAWFLGRCNVPSIKSFGIGARRSMLDTYWIVDRKDAELVAEKSLNEAAHRWASGLMAWEPGDRPMHCRGCSQQITDGEAVFTFSNDDGEVEAAAHVYCCGLRFSFDDTIPRCPEDGP